MGHDTAIRLGAFSGIFFLIATWESMAPRRGLKHSKITRWYSNVGIVFLNSLLLQALFPVLAVQMSIMSEEGTWGLLNHFKLPFWLSVVAAVVILDFVIYSQHVLFHALPALWRLHRVHHSDLDYDVTTGARFHPLEIILSMLIKLAAVVVMGPPPVAVLIFEVLLNATAMFNHGNIYIPSKIDRVLRLLIVTPDMHRVHHSIILKETNSNFGFNLPWWDRLFGTYRDQPENGHHGMTIGIKAFRLPRYLHLHYLLAQPFFDDLEESSLQ